MPYKIYVLLTIIALCAISSCSDKGIAAIDGIQNEVADIIINEANYACDRFSSVDIFGRCEDEPLYGEEKLELQNYLLEKLVLLDVTGIDKAKILVETLIDLEGNTCVSKIKSYHHYNNSFESIPDVINDMPAWKPASQRGVIIYFREKIYLFIEEGKIKSIEY